MANIKGYADGGVIPPAKVVSPFSLRGIYNTVQSAMTPDSAKAERAAQSVTQIVKPPVQAKMAPAPTATPVAPTAQPSSAIGNYAAGTATQNREQKAMSEAGFKNGGAVKNGAIRKMATMAQ